ncbi:MAG TPA: hypothetical protein PLL95_14175 [Anaerolineales bacterium]|nr:hypothetical protein [Anaerolineales bacterium]
MPKESKTASQRSKDINSRTKKPNYQLISIIISIIAITASSILGIFSLFGDGGFRKPSLRYGIYQVVYGQLLFEIKNTGTDTANNVTINMVINPNYDTNECIALSPFQDILPIQASLDLENIKQYELPTITWRVPNLPQGASFYFDCKIYYTQANSYKIPEGQSSTSTANVLEFLLSQDTIPVPTPIGEKCYTVRKTHINSVSEWQLEEFLTTDIILSFEVFAENSKPAKSIEDSSEIFVWRPKEPAYIDYEIEFCSFAEK